MPADARAARDGIVAAVRAGPAARARLAAAATRMVALLLHVAHADAEPLPLGSSWRALVAAVRRGPDLGRGTVLGPPRRRTRPRHRAAATRSRPSAAAARGTVSPSAGGASASRWSPDGSAGRRGPAWSSHSTGPTCWPAPRHLSGSRRTARPPARWTPWRASSSGPEPPPDGCRCGCPDTANRLLTPGLSPSSTQSGGQGIAELRSPSLIRPRADESGLVQPTKGPWG